MDVQEATQYCKENAISILRLQKSKHGKGFICPLCNSGSGSKGTGAFTQGTNNPNTFHCFACDFTGDYFDVIADMEHLQRGSVEAFKRGYDMANISVDYPKTQREPEPPNTSKEEPKTDYTSYFSMCHQHAKDTRYFSLRGISDDMIERFNLGFDANWRSPKALKEGYNPPPTERIIIPVDKYTYTARATNANTDKGFQKMKEGTGKNLFNLDALKGTQPVIIVEGELDAISIVQCGGNALGLRSTTNYSLLVEKLKNVIKNKAIILALDNDKAGKQCTKELLKNGEALGIHTFIINLYGNYKDANETLIADKEGLTEKIKKAMENPAKAEYEQFSDDNCLRDFIANIMSEERGKKYPTGFNNLDTVLGGGLYAGLYAIGAISSLGKTTFILQIASNLAKQGFDVLFFSLEMDRTELIAKHISRHTAEISLQEMNNARLAQTTRTILSGYEYSKLNPQQQSTIYKAMNIYGGYCKNIYTVQGNMDYSIEQVQRRIEKHIDATGKKPIVFIDYLQILSLEAEQNGKSFSDKQKADKLVSNLKRISRDYNIPVVAISSFNRDSYTQPVTMSSFKESGGIEYSCDTLIGLQYAGMDYEPKEGKDARPKRIYALLEKVKQQAKAGMSVSVECKILKNRNGGRDTTKLEFYPMFNLYEEL